eukprot:767382-Hanusia_phi.AAC.2
MIQKNSYFFNAKFSNLLDAITLEYHFVLKVTGQVRWPETAFALVCPTSLLLSHRAFLLVSPRLSCLLLLVSFTPCIVVNCPSFYRFQRPFANSTLDLAILAMPISNLVSMSHFILNCQSWKSTCTNQKLLRIATFISIFFYCFVLISCQPDHANVGLSYGKRKHFRWSNWTNAFHGPWNSIYLKDVQSDVILNGVVNLGIVQEVAGAISDWPFGQKLEYVQGQQPSIALLDVNGNIRSQYCNLQQQCIEVAAWVTASLFNNPACSSLLGNTSIRTVNGVARFTDLRIPAAGKDYKLLFSVGTNQELFVVSNSFDVVFGRLNLIDFQLSQISAGQAIPPFNVTIEKYDRISQSWNRSMTYAGEILLNFAVQPCSIRADVQVCTSALFEGTTILSVIKGQATFTDLNFFTAATSFNMIFTSGGMMSYITQFAVVAATADRLLLLHDVQPGAVAGKGLSSVPTVNLVDKYRNSILDQGWSIRISTSAVQSETGENPKIFYCTDNTCANYREWTLDLPLNAQDYTYTPFSVQAHTWQGVAYFPNLLFEIKAVGVQIIFLAIKDSVSVGPIFSSSFQIVENVLNKMIVANYPRSEAWTDANNPPHGATAGFPFANQPAVKFVDAFGNQVNLQNEPVTCTLRGGGSNANLLVGNKVAITSNGFAAYTDLTVTKVGTYWLELKTALFLENTPTFNVVHGPISKISYLQQPVNNSNKEVMDPQVVLMISDQFANTVLLPYVLTLRVHATRVSGPLQGASIDPYTYVSCGKCTTDYSPRFNTNQGFIYFTDLSIVLDPSRENDFGLALEAVATNLSACEVIGTAYICSSSAEFVHGRKVLSISQSFNTYTIRALKINAQPRDTVASM